MSLENNSQSNPNPQANVSNGQVLVQPEADPRQLFKMTGAESPMDFLKRNMEAKGITNGSQAQPGDLHKEKVETVEEEEVEETSFNFHPEAAEEEAPVDSPKEPEEAEDPDLSDPKTDIEINFKKVRENLKAEKQAAKEEREKRLALEAELEEYKKGKKLPDAVQKQEEEIARLKKYETIHGLKDSAEYHDKVIKPLTEKAQEQEEICREYEVPFEVFDRIKGMKLKDQNQFLSENFDTTAQLKLRTLLDEEAKILRDREEMHKEPEKALARLISEGEALRARRLKEQSESMQDQMRTAWGKVLQDIKQENKFVELIHRPNDSKFNNEVVNPIIRSASQEASKLMSLLIRDGLTKISPEVAEFISKMTLLGHSSALNAVTRDRAMQHVKELETNTQRFNSVIRPPIGGSSVNVGASSQERARYTPETMAKAASKLLPK